MPTPRLVGVRRRTEGARRERIAPPTTRTPSPSPAHEADPTLTGIEQDESGSAEDPTKRRTRNHGAEEEGGEIGSAAKINPFHEGSEQQRSEESLGEVGHDIAEAGDDADPVPEVDG